MRGRRRFQKGNALVGTLIAGIGLIGFVYATTTMSAVELKESQIAIDRIKASAMAEAGVEQAMRYLRSVVKKTSVFDPLLGLRNLLAGKTVRLFVGREVRDGTRKIGEFSVTVSGISDPNGVTVTINSTGYVPSAPQNMPPGHWVRAWKSFSVEARFEVGPSRVFDYGYFINNWGWLYGSSIVCNGNVRSNGQFDAAGYRPWVNGQPLYDEVSWDGTKVTLNGYHDDNGDGKEDGKDGGIFAGWDIVGAHNIRGIGGNTRNQHDFQEQVEMPNLTDMTLYEQEARNEGGGIRIGGIRVADSVYGDDPGEKDNLFLIGTRRNPIVLDGTVIVKGNVIISGYVTGKGAIYAGGNVYVPNSIRYLNPPDTPRPANNTKRATRKWLEKNWNKDFLGLFARENIVVGDHTDGLWRRYVSRWMRSNMNKSEEDAGEDGIPNTKAGKDGIPGTADDDVLEDDNVFTVEYYTQADSELGLIPPGKTVGDPIPGTGEDIDGDGVYDDTTNIEDDIDFKVPLNSKYWGGNIPKGRNIDYRRIASLEANRLDATFYTNHSFCWLVLGGAPAQINGAIVSRNEDIIYGTPRISINYDCRLLGGGAGDVKKFLPRTLKPVRILRWEEMENDPNKYVPKP